MPMVIFFRNGLNETSEMTRPVNTLQLPSFYYKKKAESLDVFETMTLIATLLSLKGSLKFLILPLNACN